MLSKLIDLDVNYRQNLSTKLEVSGLVRKAMDSKTWLLIQKISCQKVLWLRKDKPKVLWFELVIKLYKVYSFILTRKICYNSFIETHQTRIPKSLLLVINDAEIEIIIEIS